MEKVHAEKMYECTSCFKAFATIDKLNSHRDKHLCEKLALPCSVCQKVFRTAVNLEKHLLKCENVMEVPRVSARYNSLN